MQRPYLFLIGIILIVGVAVPFLSLEVLTPGRWTRSEVLSASALSAILCSGYVYTLKKNPPSLAPWFLWRLYAVSGTLALASTGIFFVALLS